MELKPTQEASGQRRMPLEGIRVADFSWIQAGPWVGRYFANYGAEVIMIADLRDPDYAEAIATIEEVAPGRGTSHGSAKESVSKLSDVRERMQHVEAVWQAFLRTHTKQELFVGAQTRGVVLMPVNTVKDIVEDIDLQERNYFVHVLHPELGQSLKYPGPPYRLSETPWRIVRRAPLIREHNVEIYEKELGFTKEQLAIMKAANVF